jgi:adenylate kinase
LLLDLKVTPSSLFISGKDEPAPGDDEPAEEEGDILAMEWHCKSGLPENIQLVKKEFEKQHKHRPIKILIAGPPASGKSFFGQQMAEHFNVPHIHMLKLIADLESWDQEKEDKYQKRETER